MRPFFVPHTQHQQRRHRQGDATARQFEAFMHRFLHVFRAAADEISGHADQ
jgi:hypothetical protein